MKYTITIDIHELGDEMPYDVAARTLEQIITELDEGVPIISDTIKNGAVKLDYNVRLED